MSRLGRVDAISPTEQILPDYSIHLGQVYYTCEYEKLAEVYGGEIWWGDWLQYPLIGRYLGSEGVVI